MTDYEIKMSKPISPEVMQNLKIEQGFNHFGLEMSWDNQTITLKNISNYSNIPGIAKAFKANAKFIMAFLCEMHACNGKLYQGNNIVDAYYGADDPSLADDIWNSIKRWTVIALK